MKESILKLRSEGKSFREISKILGCSKSLISYHCSAGQAEKSKLRVKKLRGDNPVLKKIDNYKARKKLSDGCNDFNRRGNQSDKFSSKDVLEKFGDSPKCYLTGRPIDWNDNESYAFDHREPVSKGGSNSLDNLELAHPQANQAKDCMTVEEFLALCKEVLLHHGYDVTNPSGC